MAQKDKATEARVRTGTIEARNHCTHPLRLLQRSTEEQIVKRWGADNFPGPLGVGGVAFSFLDAQN